MTFNCYELSRDDGRSAGKQGSILLAFPPVADPEITSQVAQRGDSTSTLGVSENAQTLSVKQLMACKQQSWFS